MRVSLLVVCCVGCKIMTPIETDATPTAAQAAYELVAGYPTLPDGMVFGPPAGVAVDDRGNVLVFHRAGRGFANTEIITAPTVFVFDAKGLLIDQWGAGEFVVPHGIAVDGHRNVWLTDVGTNRVYKYTHTGKRLLALDHGFDQPTDVAFGPDGSVYVSDGYGHARVVKMDEEGRLLATWGSRGTGNGEFRTPHGIAVDTDGHVYVADRGNARIQVFDADGQYLAQWKGRALGRPWGIALGRDGSVFMVDGGDQSAEHPRGRLLRALRDGTVIDRWSGPGRDPGKLDSGHDVAVDAEGNVYVVDVGGGRLQKFRKRR